MENEVIESTSPSAPEAPSSLSTAIATQPAPAEPAAKPFTIEWLDHNRAAPAPETEAVALSDELIAVAAQEPPITAKPFTEEWLEQKRDPTKRTVKAAKTGKTAKLDAGAIIGNFFDKKAAGDDDDRATGLLERLYDRDYNAYERLIDAVVEAHGA